MMGRFRCALTVSILVVLGLIASSASFAQGDIWPTYLYDARNSGRCPWTGPNGPFMKWSYPDVQASSVAIATDGTLRLTSAFESKAYALNPDGSFRWSYDMTAGGLMCSPAIASDSSVIVRGNGGSLYRLDREANLVWSYDGAQANGWTTAPVIADEMNLVFITAWDHVHAVYMSGALQSTAAWAESWAPQRIFDSTSPAFYEDTVYLTGRASGAGFLIALEASTGTLKWEYPDTGTIDIIDVASPSISEDGTHIFFGDGGDTENAAVLYSVLASDGTLDWSWDNPSGAGIISAPAIGTDGTLYVVDDAAVFHAIASDGTLKWSIDLGFPTGTRPKADVIVDATGTVYVTASAGMLYSISPMGCLYWTYDLHYDEYVWLWAASISTDGTLYCPTFTVPDTVYAFHSGSWVTNASVTPTCGSSATIYEFSVDCVFPPTVSTLRTVQVYLDDGLTVVDLCFDSGVTWTGTVSTLAEGPYQYYVYYETWGGITGAYPETGWLEGFDVDNTAPTSECWTDYQCYTSSPIDVRFTSSDYFTGVTRVNLWYRRTPDCEGQKWWGDWTYLMCTDATIGVFSVPWSLEGRIEFLTIAEDCANMEAKSTRDCWLKYDDTAPITYVTSGSSCWGGPGYPAPIRVDYNVDESCTYEPDVELWYRYDGGSWTYDQREEGSGSQGYFNFIPDLEGEYTFGCVTTDNCGNDEGTPGSIVAVLYDTTAPTSIVTGAPECDNDGAFDVNIKATDASISPNMSGLLYIWLYYQFNGGSWQYYGNSHTYSCAEGASDAVHFVAPNGDGIYGFYVVARDCCNNTEAAPTDSTPPDMETIVDTTDPRSRAISPDMKRVSPFDVDYVADDATSGVDTVTLYWNLDGGAWNLYTGTGDTQTGATGTFPFEYPGQQTNGVLGFYTRATDNCGNQEAAPNATTPPDCSTVFDDTPPVSTPLYCTSASQGTLLVTGESTDNLTGIDAVVMYYRLGAGSYSLYGDPPIYTSWIDPPNHLSYVFSFPPMGDGQYEFYFLASDAAGNDETTPAGTVTGYWDTSAPVSNCWAGSHYVNTTPVNLSYSADDWTTTVDEIWLYYRFGELDGFDVTGSSLGGGSASVAGNVDFEMQHGEGTYYFYTLSKDEMGNWELPPANADWWVMLDQTPPTSHCISPRFATSLPFEVHFHSYDMPSAGVEETQLWYSYNGGAWTDSGLTETGDYGTFCFSPGDGEGVYDLCTRALDRAGNLSDIPTDPHSTTVYDGTAPVSTCGCPSSANTAPVDVDYTAADPVSGIAQVRLYHSYNFGAWSYTGMAKTADTGTFHYDPTQGDGRYDFYVIAQNNAGLWEVKAAADDSCNYTGTTPTSKAEAPMYASEGTIEFLSIQSTVPGIEVEYEAYTPGADVSDVTLWWRYEGNTWYEYDGDYGYTEPTGAVLFPWQPPHGHEGLYEFFTILEDTNGKVEHGPTDADTSCIYDITPPWSSVETIDEVSAATIYLDYVADDPHEEGVTPSGLYSVTLWFSYEGGIWLEYVTIEDAPTAGTIIFDHPPASDGTLSFYTIAKDRADNREAIPSTPDDGTVYDGEPPVSTVGTILPYYRTNPNIPVTYRVTDNYSGVAFIDLWYRYDDADSPWAYTGFRHLSPVTGAGQFNFAATEGKLEFYTIATDNFGNVEAAPGSPDATACYDVTAPESEILSTDGTLFFNEAPIPVYYRASDEVSGINLVDLYYRFNGGSWSYSGLMETGTEGRFLFTPPASKGAGLYEFYTVARDNAGNTEAAPTSDFHAVQYDLEAPTSSATGPLFTDVPDIDVEYVASDDLSGVALVGVWYRFAAGGWVPWLDYFGDSTVGTIAMTLPYGEGDYYIFTQSVDNAGNIEAWKSEHEIVTIYDAQAPWSTCYCDDYSTSSPIPVRFAALDPNSSGIAEVCLQFNYEGRGWEDSGLCESTASGVFDFVPATAGTYRFRTVATDNSGNTETPSGYDETYYDDVVPTSWCTCATVASSAPFDIDFGAEDGTGTFDSVELWVRYSPDEGTTWTIGWQETGMFSEELSGTFRFDPTFGDGLYQFYTIASDVAGNLEAAPSECDCWTNYAGSGPSSFGLAPAIWNGANIPVTYTASAPSGSTIASVWLYWRRYVGPDYTGWHKYTDSYGTGTTGTIYFDYPVANALYEFFTVAKQTDGTTETPPWPWVPDSACQLDSVDPNSSCTSDSYVEGIPIVVDFSAYDTGVGVADVALYYNFNGGAYNEYAEHATESGGYGFFVFDPPLGQGVYGFYTIATDEAGNVEAPPVSPPDTSTVWDVSKPSSEITNVAPDPVTTGTITIDFVSSDPVPNGVTLVGLWYNVDGGVWKHSGHEVIDSNIVSGLFNFTALDGDGLYGFFTIAEDNWGNVEDPPMTPDGTCLVDSTAPQSQCTTANTYLNQTPVPVSFTATDGSGNVSGVDHTDLWYSFNGGAWCNSGLSSAGLTGFYFFTPAEGDGVYSLYTISTDVAGNVETAPAEPDRIFYLDRQGPATDSTSPECVTSPSIQVEFSGVDYGPSGIAGTRLYYRRNSGNWIMYGTQYTASGTWYFTPTLEGVYDFATNSYDLAGNYEFPYGLWPPTVETTTTYDATAPWSSCESPECSVDLEQIVVPFSAGDNLSGVASTELWVKMANWEAWQASGLVLTGASGQFVWPIVPYDFEGVVSFYTISRDNCGNVETPPLDGLGHVTFDTQTVIDWTAPESVCSTLSEFTREAMVEIDWIATDATAGVAITELWYSLDSQPYVKHGVYFGTSGTVEFDLFNGEGIYRFYTISVDACDNRESRPGYADVVVRYDLTAPTSTVFAPEYANSLPFTVSFIAEDNLPGELSTTLEYCFDGLCFQYGDPIIGHSGDFIFHPEDLEGVYEFHTITTDVLGNVELVTLSAKVSTIYDRTKPASSAISPAVATSLPIEVDYIASDGGPAGLEKVTLWYRMGSTEWLEYTAEHGTAPIGAISFDAPGGVEGVYEFVTVAVDRAGNCEWRPGQGGETPVVDCTTAYDLTAPESSASAPMYTNASPIAVSFTASDAVSGVTDVSLYACFGEGGLWTATGLSSSETTGAFSYVPNSGEGTYYFYTVAQDAAGHTEAVPVEADASSLYDVTAPMTVLSGPSGVSSLPITLDFTCAPEPTQLSGSPIDSIVLYYRFNNSAWLSTGLSAGVEEGSFNFWPTEGPGKYDFYTIGADMAGNSETRASKPLTTVWYDSSAPTSTCWCNNTYRQFPLAVSFGADGTGSGIASVELFYNWEGMGWLSSGLVLTGDTGVFLFPSHPEGDGRYEFYTVATDLGGNTEVWDGNADCAAFLDTVAPETAASSPVWVTSSPIIVTFDVVENGIGIAVVELWQKYESYSWQKVDEKHGQMSGQFEYETEVTSGEYHFYTVGRDLAGNTEPEPTQSTAPDTTTSFDIMAPITSVKVPQYSVVNSIDIGYRAIEDSSASGVASVTLWARFNRGGWYNTGYAVTGTQGTISAVALNHGPGVYDFYSIGLDNAGNEERPPSLYDGRCIYDASKPLSNCWAASCVAGLPLNVRFTAKDPESGVDHVSLWYRFDDGDWQQYGLPLPDALLGTFGFDAPEGEGVYEFYTISVNNAGLTEDAPAEADAVVYYDVTIPSSSVSSPDTVAEDSIPVFFSAWDTGSGVHDVDLWYRFEDRPWVKSGHTVEATTGTIEFWAPDGVGTYCFWTVATDQCGNSEDAPVTGATVSAVTTFDNVPPTSRVSAEVEYTNVSPIEVAFEASDRGVGIASVRLWYSVGGGTFKDTGLMVTNATIGVFEFVPVEGDGEYDFYSIAEDGFGNRENAPSRPDDTVVYDTTAPYSSAESPTEVHEAQMTVTFSATDVLSPIASVSLWYRFAETLGGQWSEWTDTELTVEGPAGMTLFNATEGEGYYEFYTIATDAAGNAEQPPTSADTRTQYRILYPEISLSHESYDFGEVQVDASSFWPFFYVSNTGEAPLTIESCEIDNSCFACNVLFPVTVDPSMSVFMPIVFSPAEAGLAEGTMTIHSNDPENPEVEVELSGTGVEASLKLAVSLQSNGGVFYPNDNLRVTISGKNGGPALNGLDLYISLILPSGGVVYLPDFSTEPRPYVADFDMGAGVAASGLEILNATIPEGFSPGNYVWRAYVTWTGQPMELSASTPLTTTVDLRPEIGLSLNSTYPVYGDSEMHVLTARLKNSGLTKTMDLYVALQTPDGSLLFGPDLTPTFAPCFDDYELPRHADVWPVMLCSKSLKGLPRGAYRWFVAFSDAQSFNLISSIAQIEWELE